MNQIKEKVQEYLRLSDEEIMKATGYSEHRVARWTKGLSKPECFVLFCTSLAKFHQMTEYIDAATNDEELLWRCREVFVVKNELMTEGEEAVEQAGNALYRLERTLCDVFQVDELTIESFCASHNVFEGDQP